MNDWVLQSPHPVLVAVLALGVIGHVLGVYRTNRSTARKALLLILNTLFAVLLWLFVQPPTQPEKPQTLTLLTPGATAADVRVAQRTRYSVAIGENVPIGHDHRTISRHHDLRSVRAAFPTATTLKVLGAGLTEHEWQTDPSWAVQFDPPAPVGGFRSVNWSERLAVGERLVITGRIENLNSATVELMDPAGDVVEHSTLGSDGRFSVSAELRSPGRFSYRLTVSDNTPNVVESQTIPVHVVNPAPVDILMLLSSPSFESRSIKRWAGIGGARLTIRTAISKDRYLDEFVDTEPMSAEQLSQLDRSLLSTYDLIVADQRGWQTLGPARQRALLSAVEQDGLGIIVLVRDAEQPLDSDDRFPALLPYSERERRLALPQIASTSNDSTTSPVTLAPVRFAPDSPSDVIALRDVNGIPVVVASRSGRGLLGVTLVTDSHILTTSGQSDAHAHYWRSVVQTMARPTKRPNIERSPAQSFVHERVQLCVFGDPLPTAVQVNEDLTIALRPQRYRPQELCGYWWPMRSGWHSLSTSNVTHHVYVYNPNEWKTQRALDATAATFVASQQAPKFSASALFRTRPVSRVGFAWLLLLLASVLWWEQKLRNN